MLFMTGEGGQGMVEYAMVLVFIAVVVIAVISLFGPQVGNMYSRITFGW